MFWNWKHRIGMDTRTSSKGIGSLMDCYAVKRLVEVYLYFFTMLFFRVWYVFRFGTFSPAQITISRCMTYSVPTEGAIRCVNRAPTISLFTRLSFCHLPLYSIDKNAISSALTIDKLCVSILCEKQMARGSKGAICRRIEHIHNQQKIWPFTRSWPFVTTGLPFLLLQIDIRYSFTHNVLKKKN